MKENKMGVMEVKKLILTMSFPIMLSMLIQALYNVVDSMFVARVSQDALAAVSLCYPVQMIMVAVACGSGVGVNALLSRYLGEKKPKQAEQVAMHGLFLAVCSWVVFAFAGLFLSAPFLRLFSQDKTIVSMGVEYMRICTVCSFGVFVQITYERIMQSTGNTIYNMLIQGIGALVNIILDPLFIFGWGFIPALGVSGAAIATVTGQITAMALGIVITRKRIKEIHLSFQAFRVSKTMIRDLYRIGIPAILMQSIMSFMTVMMNMILVSFSALAVSVFSVYYKLQQFVFMAVLGMNNALIPIIAYNYGAMKGQRIREAIHFALIVSGVIMAAGTLLFQLFPYQLLQLFEADEEMFAIGVPALRTISLSFVFAGISMVLCSAFQALGSAVRSLIVTLLRQMVLLLPLAYALAMLSGLELCWWAFPLTEGVCALLSLWLLRDMKRSMQVRLSA